MLPDFPSLKNDLERLLQLGAQWRASSTSGIAATLPTRDVHEGDRSVLVREDGEEVSSGYDTVSSEMSFTAREAETLTLKKTFEMYADLLVKLEVQKGANFVAMAKEEAESKGQVVQGAGKPLAEAILEAVEKMEIDPGPRDIDDLFRFQGMRVFLHGLDDEAIEKARGELKRETYRTRVKSLLEKKREEHRAREGSRKLVG